MENQILSIDVIPKIWRKVISEAWELHKWKTIDKPLEELIIVPENAQYFAVIGAVFFLHFSEELVGLSYEHKPLRNLDALDSYIAKGQLEKLKESGNIKEPLIKSEEELTAFSHKYNIPEFVRMNFRACDKIDCWLVLTEVQQVQSWC